MNLREVRQAAGWGKNRGHWHDIESGRKPNPTLKTLVQMAQALGCKVGDMVLQTA